MVDSEQFLAAFTHLSLRGEEVFRSSFVANFRLSSDVSKPIKRRCLSSGKSTDEATTFSRHHFPGMSDHGLEMFAAELNCWHVGVLKIRVFLHASSTGNTDL